MSGVWPRWWQSGKKMFKDLTKTWNIVLLVENIYWTGNGLKHSKFFLTSFILSLYPFHWLIASSFILNIKIKCSISEHHQMILLEKKKKVRTDSILLKWIVFIWDTLGECFIFLHFKQELIMVQEKTCYAFWFLCFLLQFGNCMPFPLALSILPFTY